MQSPEKGFIYIKTPFMTLLECGHPSIEDLQTRYYFIIDVIRLNTKEELILLLKREYAYCKFDERFIDYINESRIIKANGTELLFLIVEQKIFSASDGKLVLLDEGEYEIINTGNNYCLGLQRYRFADYFGETIKKIPLSSVQLDQWQSLGKSVVDDYVKQQRLQHWEHKPIWVVIIKAKVESGLCSIAMDGSDFYIYYSCVPADSPEEVATKITQYLEADFLSATQIYEVKPFVEKDYADETESGIEIIQAAKMAYERQKIYTYAVTPYFMTSFLITPYETIISKWHCDSDYWSKRVDKMELCEFFPDKKLCFTRLLELEKLSSFDLEAFNSLYDLEEEPAHYRITSEHNSRFEKIQDFFEANWKCDVQKTKDGIFLKVHMVGVCDQILEIKLVDYQESRYEREGMGYIQKMIKRI